MTKRKPNNQHCPECASRNIQGLGVRMQGEHKHAFFKCKDCATKFSVPDIIANANDNECTDDLNFVRSPETVAAIIKNTKTFVVTTAVNNVEIHEGFFNVLLKYCDANNAKLIVLPIRYKNPSMLNTDESVWYDDKIVPYLIENNFDVDGQVRILGALKLQATTDSPISSLDSLSKGHTIIVGHTQVALRTLPRIHRKYPPISVSTGAITHNNYSNTKVGYKASFNHSYAAVVCQLVGKEHLIRHIQYDGHGVADLGDYYTADSVTRNNPIDTLVMGDAHVGFTDSLVIETTFGKGGIVETLKPKTLILHDVLDSYSISHHHQNNVFIRFAKFKDGANNIEQELDSVVEFIDKYAPMFDKVVIVAANHNDHLQQWLSACNPKEDLTNAVLYHELMFRMLRETRMGPNGALYPNPFELYTVERLKSKNVSFLGRSESLKIHGIEVGCHGDKGTNGSKGSLKQFSGLPLKTISGHSHSPGINKGAYAVGTSSRFDLEYASGASTWDHCHCIIHTNGKRQLLFIRPTVKKSKK